MPKEDNRVLVGMNGFGRFALNLLWWWFNDRHAPYRIGFINDEQLTPEKISSIIKSDSLVTGFRKCKIVLTGTVLMIQAPDGRTEHISISSGPAERAGWLGEPGIFFECSGGRSSGADLCRPFLVGKTKTVIVSATCYDADATLVMGYNHESFDPTKHKVISYGSCTVNPGVVLTATMNDMFCVVGCTVHVIHNVQEHRLLHGETQTLQRKFCTLERMAPQLLPFLNGKIAVKYTVIPWAGASIIDFAFRVEKPVTREKAVGVLKEAVGKSGRLDGLIGMVSVDNGPGAHIGSPYSMVIVEDEIEVVGDIIHLFGYFYNEGSGIRMHELAKHIVAKL